MVNHFGRGAVSDGADTNAIHAPRRRLTKNTKTLIVYFSRSGNTEHQADLAARLLDADLFELVVQHPYPANYQQTVQRCVDEQEQHALPALQMDQVPTFSQYQTVVLGHPIWNMTIANPMQAFLQSYGAQLENTRIADFSTNAGYGSGDMQQLLHRLLAQNVSVLAGYTVEDRLAHEQESQFVRWLRQTVTHSSN
jgi:menaquinone-dependent protoporphyrinogen IX oxidase